MTFDLKEKTQKYLCHTYARYPLEIKAARGCHLYDFQDKKYIDLLSGISVCNLGHSNPEIIQALKDQAEKLIHISNLFYQEEQVLLAEKLSLTCNLDNTFFCNSGAEANEGAIKLARRYMRKVRKNNKFEVITLSGSFHGRTLATLTATGQDKIKDGFDPLPVGFKTTSFNDPHALERAVTPETAAIMVEIIQGEGGIKILSPEFMEKIKQICHEHEILLIVDEIQTGLGRTGRFWAHQHFNLDPDIITSAKALANGLPIGAVLAKEHVAKAFDAGSHGTTFGGNPLCCAAALKALEIIERDKITERADQLGKEALGMFEKIKDNHPEKIREIRGKGLMLAIDLSFSGNKIWNALLEKNFVLNLTQDTVLRLLPPLIISRDDLQRFAQTLDQLLMIPELCGEQ